METEIKDGFEQELAYKFDIPLEAPLPEEFVWPSARPVEGKPPHWISIDRSPVCTVAVRGVGCGGDPYWKDPPRGYTKVHNRHPYCSGCVYLRDLDYHGVGKLLEHEHQRPKRRVFTYYDTKDHKLLQEGWTCRLVSGFDPDKGDGKGLHRYDLKYGEVNTPNRMERSTWSNLTGATQMCGDPFSGLLFQHGLEVWAGYLNKGVASNLGEELTRCVRVRATHYKWKATVGESLIEISFDTFKDLPHGFLDASRLFQEMEIALLKGREEDLKKLRDYLLGHENFVLPGATLVTQQKYARVMDCLGQ